MEMNKQNIARRQKATRKQRMHPAVKEELAGLACASTRMGLPWNEPHERDSSYSSGHDHDWRPGNGKSPLLPAQAHVRPDGIITIGGGQYGWELRAKVNGGGVTMGIIGNNGFTSIPHRAARALAHYLLARCPSDTKKK